MPSFTRTHLRRFVTELRRRKVVRVALAYAVGAWVVIQVSATVLPHVGLPGVVVTAVIVLVAAGFPLALVLSWAYDLHPDSYGWSPAPHQAASGGPGAAPALEERVTSVRYRVPPASHPLVGRQEAVAAVAALLHDNRLLTVVGPGGVGKTRLALEVGLLLQEDFEHGACLIPLAGITSIEPLIPELALRLRLPFGSNEDPRRRIVDYLREKELLLLLDNFEQLAGDSTLLVELLEAAPRVRILVTSRERLRLSAESLYPLEPLAVDAAAGGTSPAEELFLQVARRLDPAYRPTSEAARAVGRICRRLEGIPLAIELAAAWRGSLSEAEIESEIQRSQDFLQAGYRDIPDRHRNLRAAFESSWSLLEGEEQRVFSRLAVFRSGFERRGAEEVAGASRASLAALQGKSLLRSAAGGRYEVLELLRCYAEEKLEVDAREARTIRLRHSHYFSRMLVEAGSTASQLGAAPSKLEEETDNLRAAWLTGVRERSEEVLERMVGPLFEFYDLRGWAKEGVEMFQQALQVLDSLPAAHPERRTAALAGRLSTRVGMFHCRLGVAAEARLALERGRDQADLAGDALESSLALDGLGQLAQGCGEYADARRYFSGALTAAERAGDEQMRGRALAGLGLTAWMLGDNAEARRLFGEAIPVLGSRMGGALRNLGVVEAADGDQAEAEQLFKRALALEREYGNQRGVAHALQHLAVLAHERGREDEAEGHLREAIAIARETGNRRLLAYCSNLRALIALGGERHDVARGLLATALTVSAETGDRPLGLQVLIGYCRLAADEEGDAARAVEMLTAIHRHPATDQGGKEEAASALAALRKVMDQSEFAAASVRGESEEAAGALEAQLASGVAPATAPF
jgi:predicted ATPase